MPKASTTSEALYMAMGDYAKAEPLFRQALAIRKQILGEKHPDYALILNNLGGLYQRNRRLCKRSRIALSPVSVIGKEVLGDRDPTTPKASTT